MTNLTFKKFLKPALAVAMLSISGMANADAKQDLLEARQETQIWTTYALSPYLRGNDLKVSVDNGKATLTGKVDEDVNKELAKQIALGVSGIKDVDNQITVQSDYNPKGTQSYGESVDDVTITAAVKARLVWSKFSYLGTKVETKSGRVVLTGNVESKDAKELAGRLASNTRGVVSVKNQLVVDDKSTTTDSIKNSANETSKNVADIWITTKVKSNFLYSNNVSGSDIDVSTNAGIVTLKGTVNNGAERTLAIELAQNVRGVKAVEAKGLVF